MRTIKEQPVHERPREKLINNGSPYLTTEELVTVILGSGVAGNNVKDISKKVTQVLSINIRSIQDGSYKLIDNLLQIKGIGRAKACTIAASFTLFSRLISERDTVVKGVHEVLPIVSYLKEKKQEYLVCISLDGGNQIISHRVITIGLLDQSLVHPREVYAEAIKERAAGVILVHNHPSGGITPSVEDVTTTKNIVQAGEILGIRLLDHVIVSRSGYYSFNEHGLV